MNHEDKIVRDPQICGGEPVFPGTRVTLRTVLASLAAGDSVEAILADFPALKAEHVQAAIAFAAAPRKKTSPRRPPRTSDEDRPKKSRAISRLQKQKPQASLGAL
jgi:uncharacterized protein (DUF433 family)